MIYICMFVCVTLELPHIQEWTFPVCLVSVAKRICFVEIIIIFHRFINLNWKNTINIIGKVTFFFID